MRPACTVGPCDAVWQDIREMSRFSQCLAHTWHTTQCSHSMRRADGRETTGPGKSETLCQSSPRGCAQACATLTASSIPQSSTPTTTALSPRRSARTTTPWYAAPSSAQLQLSTCALLPGGATLGAHGLGRTVRASSQPAPDGHSSCTRRWALLRAQRDGTIAMSDR